MNTIYRIIGLDTRDSVPFVKKEVDILYSKYMKRKDIIGHNTQSYEVNSSDYSDVDVCKVEWKNILKCISYYDLMSVMNHFIDKYNYSTTFLMSIVKIIDYVWD